LNFPASFSPQIEQAASQSIRSIGFVVGWESTVLRAIPRRWRGNVACLWVTIPASANTVD
jgi:hypothetical protein